MDCVLSDPEEDSEEDSRKVECCSNADCLWDDPIFVQECNNNQCSLIPGILQFQLEWTGYVDLDLSVQPPDGGEITYQYTYDSSSRGFHTGDDMPSAATQSMLLRESVYFAPAQSGMYTITVNSKYISDSNTLNFALSARWSTTLGNIETTNLLSEDNSVFHYDFEATIGLLR